MSIYSTASQAVGRIALAFVLCLLTFAFAVEAKTAWYGPQAGLGSDVRAAKAMPADMPRLVAHRVPAPDPIHPGNAFAILSFVAILSIAGAEIAQRLESAREPGRVAGTPCYSPSLFLRPPPRSY